MATSGPGQSNREGFYYSAVGGTSNYEPLMSLYYGQPEIDMPVPQTVKVKGKDGKDEEHKANPRKGRPSIFSRYNIFYYNSIEGHGATPEPYFDSPNRLKNLSGGGLQGFQDVINFPTARNIINWSQSGKGNALEFAWEDFLWCKNYGHVPNNYMVTLRRFPIPVTDDLLDEKKQPTPDIGRMIAWVDGESNTWESVGLKFSTSLTWKKLESEIQSVQAQEGTGNEGNALPGALGNIVKQFSALTQPGMGEAMRSYNPSSSSIDPYADKNKVYGPIDVVKEMMVRDKGVNFEQSMTLKFEYELRSIDGINPKIAMIDLISNVLVITANRASWWGGEIRYYGGNPRNIQPLGDPSKLASGDYAGYFKSLVEGITGRLNSLTGGKGLSLEGIGNALKNVGGGLLDNIVGGGLDKMGRPGAQALNSLLSGEDTGEWHVMVGNPANPIISVGNLILEKTDIYLNGALGPDDFPSKLTVTCTLKPARPRDRTDIMSMFHRNGRTYVAQAPSAKKYSGNLKRKGIDNKTVPETDINYNYDESELTASLQSNFLINRFPNHVPNPNAAGGERAFVVDQSAQGIF